VKHGLVKRVRDYPWSTFHRFVKEGEYDLYWGGADPCPEATGPGWERSASTLVGLAPLDPPYATTQEHSRPWWLR
jgi:putative transposase